MNKVIIDEIEAFSVNENLEATVVNVGPLQVPLIIVDNFYKHPDQVRDLALMIPPSFNKRILTRLPGGRINAFYLMDHMGPIFDQLIKEHYPDIWKHLPPNHINNVMRDSTFMVNVMSTEMLEPRPPHIDCPDFRAFAATIFLNTDEESFGGTGFYTFDGEQSGVEFGLRKSDNGVHTAEYVVGDMGDWKLEYLAEMKYNRMILYPAFIYHAAYVTPEMYTNGLYRLNQMFFI